MMSKQLKPCPFCGSTNLDMRDARDFITCRDCGTEGPFTPGLGSTGSIEAWNTRADHAPDAGKKVAALELALKAKTEQLSALHKQQDAAREAIASLESERAANAILTAEIEALRAQQRQDCEPVAWMTRESERALARGGNGSRGTVPVHCERTSVSVVPLYAAPQKREPLSDEQLWSNDEIMSLNADLGWHMETIRMFASAIERAHGIGGQS